MKCPKCTKGTMKKKDGRFGEFYGCSRFPYCKYTTSTLPETSESSAPKVQTYAPIAMQPIFDKPKKTLEPNSYQAAIYEQVGKWSNGGAPKIVTKACAGSGKTTTVEQAIQLLPSSAQIHYIVFNSHNQKEAAEKLPPWVNVTTAHSFGFSLLREYFSKSPKVDSGKVGKILTDLIGYPKKLNLFYPARSFISHFKNTLLEVNEVNALMLAQRYGINFEDSDFPKIMSLVKRAIDKNNQLAKTTVDFDDMIYLPSKLEIKSPVIQYGFLDEVQDWNTAMIKMLLNSIAPDARILAVGDENQSIYGFRGADTEAMQKVQNSLAAVELPLSITYRVPVSGVELVNRIFPHIEFFAAPNAIEGSILKKDYEDFLYYVKDNDLVLCRTNAPIIKAALHLLAKNKPVKILGREFETELISLAKQFAGAFNLDEWESALKVHTYATVQNFEIKGWWTQAGLALDKMEALLIFKDNCNTVSEIVRKIEHLYADRTGGIRLSTVHRAKGLEANRVFLLRPDLMPLSYAEQDWQKIEEDNIKYVAHTRHKEEFIIVRPSK